MTSFECPIYQPSAIDIPIKNIHEVPSRIKSISSVSVIYVKRLQNSLSTNTNEKLNPSIENNRSSKITIPHNVTVSKVKRSKSLASNAYTNKKSSAIIRRSSSVRVTRLKRSSTLTPSNISKPSNSSSLRTNMKRLCSSQKSWCDSIET